MIKPCSSSQRWFPGSGSWVPHPAIEDQKRYINFVLLALSTFLSELVSTSIKAAAESHYCFPKRSRDKNYRPTCTVDLRKLGLFDKRRLRDRNSLAKPECVCEQISPNLSDLVVKSEEGVDDLTPQINIEDSREFKRGNQRSDAEEE